MTTEEPGTQVDLQRICPACGIDFTPHKPKGKKLESYCAYCIYRPYMSDLELLQQIDMYSRTTNRLSMDRPADVRRIKRLIDTQQRYAGELVRRVPFADDTDLARQSPTVALTNDRDEEETR